MSDEIQIIRLFEQFRILCNLLLFLSLTVVNSAQQFSFKTYNRSTGLPSDYIMCAFQDKAGYLWFGTDQGAARYDGKSFVVFNASKGLNNNFILKIFQDKNRSMWFGLHEGGVTKYDGKKFYSFDIKNGLSGNSVKNILEDKYGRIYFDLDEGIEIYHQNNFSFQKIHNQHRLLVLLKDGSVLINDSLSFKRIIPSNDLMFQTIEVVFPKEVNKIFKPNFGPLGAHLLSNGNVCIYGMLGLVELSDVENENPKVERLIPDISIESVTEDKEGRIWCGTENKGIICLEKDSLKFVKCLIKKNSQDRISTAFCDNEGNLWFGTMGSGVQKFVGPYLTVFDNKSGLTNEDVTVIYEDSLSNVWIGTRTGINVITKNKLILLEQFIPEIKEVRCFAEDKNNNIYIGTFDPMYGPTTLNQIISRQKIRSWVIPYGVSSICAENANSIWISTYGGGTYHYSDHKFKLFQISDGITSNMIEKTIATKDAIWFLSKNNGASKYQNGTFTTYSKANGLPSNTIYDIYEDDDITLFGTDEGLAQLSKNGFITYSAKDGLIGNKVLAVFTTDKQKGYWVLTNEALHKFRNDSIKSLGNFILLPSHDASINNVFYCNSSQSLWLATTMGVIKIDLTKIQPKKYHPSVKIINAYADTMAFYDSFLNSYCCSKDTITTLDYFQNDVIINFSALSFTNEQLIKYIYKMEGFDNNWSKPTSESKVRYRNLSPGNYTFYVYAINGDGLRSSQPSKISFIISPPYWKKTWFLLLLSTLFLSALIGYIRYYTTKKLRIQISRLEEEKKLREERDRTREQISRDLHDDISSTLGSIALYSESFKRQSPELSARQKNILDKISELSSEAIDHMSDIIWSVTPEHDNLNQILLRMKNYMVEVCSINRLEYEINVLELEENVSIKEDVRRNIYLIFKEAINNILKHADASKVTLIIKYNNETLVMIIEDNGKGFEQSSDKLVTKEKINKLHSGHGINNMKKRADEIKAEFKIESSSDSGTRITLKKRMT